MVKSRLRRALRFISLLAAGLFAAGLLLLIVSLTVGGIDWTIESVNEVIDDFDLNLRERARRSSLVRWWRCRGIDRPELQNIISKGYPNGWTLLYSWTDGYGKGDVYLTIQSDGKAKVELHEHGTPQPKVIRAQVPQEMIQQIAATIDETCFLCLMPLERVGYRIADLGCYTIKLEAGIYSKTVFADEKHYVADPDAFESVLDAIYDLENVFGERISWGPYGITKIADP
jgi:hypothetical protein